LTSLPDKRREVSSVCSHFTSTTEAETPLSSSFTCIPDEQPQTSSSSAERILTDMFRSHCVTGTRASIFHCSDQHLRNICLLHGLDVTQCSKLRDVKIRLLYHLINGDCFTQRCEPHRPSPDRTACLCVVAGFSSALGITTFIVNLLNHSSASKVSTEDLLLVESTGNQLPYESKLHLCRGVLNSLHAFLLRCCQRLQRDASNLTTDPFGDLFMGFEGKRKPVLESIMNHHGPLVPQDSKLSVDKILLLI
jgi:hypothetical protein